MTTWVRGFALVAVLALGVLGAIAWRASESEATVSPPRSTEDMRQSGQTTVPDGSRVAEDARVPVVRVAPVVQGPLSTYASANGYLEPWAEVEVVAEIGGRVVARKVEEGSSVTDGALLIQLDDRDRRIELNTAEAELLKVQAAFAVDYEVAPTRRETISASPDEPDLATLRQQLEAARQQMEEGLIARRELEELERRLQTREVLTGRQQGEVRAATSGLTQAEQEVERRRLALDRTRIRAPFSGRVADLDVEIGQQVNAGEVLLRLQTKERLKVSVDVLEKDIVHIRPGAPARVRFPSLPDVELRGEVATVNPRIDAETGSGRVTVAIRNPGRNERGRALLPGLYTSVEIETRRLDGRVTVPARALLERQGRQLVFRIEDGRALWTYVDTGIRTGSTTVDRSLDSRVEIVDGLQAGQVVAVEGHFALAHEARVEVAGTDEGSPR